MSDAIKEIDSLERIYPETSHITQRIKAAIENDQAEAYKKGYTDAAIEHAVQKSKVLDKINKRMHECASVGLVAEKIACARVAEWIGDLL